jgi:hypothetical protein
MRGLLLGDADVKKSECNCAFRIRSTNKVFLEWLDDELSPLSRGVRLEETGKSKKEKALENDLDGVTKSSEFKDLYGLYTVSSDEATKLREWYISGKKRYPSEITKKMFKYWYVCDGWASGRNIAIRCEDQSDDSDRVLSLIENAGLEPTSFDVDRGIIRISAQSSRRFLNSTKPVEGFQRKWDDLIYPKSGGKNE